MITSLDSILPSPADFPRPFPEMTAGVYWCPPTEKFEDLKPPPAECASALSYAGEDAAGHPVFWVFENGKWKEDSVLFVYAGYKPVHEPAPSLEKRQISQELYWRFICSAIGQWPEILERYRPTDSVPEFLRAGQDCVCSVCQLPYWKHEYDKRYPIPSSMWVHENRPEYFLHKLCDGTLVKL